jgi:hypothetical protein
VLQTEISDDLAGVYGHGSWVSPTETGDEVTGRRAFRAARETKGVSGVNG